MRSSDRGALNMEQERRAGLWARTLAGVIAVGAAVAMVSAVFVVVVGFKHVAYIIAAPVFAYGVALFGYIAAKGRAPETWGPWKSHG
jgi:hypothetical protein